MFPPSPRNPWWVQLIDPQNACWKLLAPKTKGKLSSTSFNVATTSPLDNIIEIVTVTSSGTRLAKGVTQGLRALEALV